MRGLQSAREIYWADERADISDMRLLQSLLPINLSPTTESSHPSVLSPRMVIIRHTLGSVSEVLFKSLQIYLLSDFASALRRQEEPEGEAGKTSGVVIMSCLPPSGLSLLSGRVMSSKLLHNR